MQQKWTPKIRPCTVTILRSFRVQWLSANCSTVGMLQSPGRQMAVSNTSNENRKEYRKKCRQKMSEHICKSIPQRLLRGALICEGTKLGITVKPEDVRLITTSEDRYAWRVLPEKEHLFRKDILRKHISKHSIEAYRHLCRAIGNSLEAVSPPEPAGVDGKTFEERANVPMPFDV